ncbi:MAG: hypothetical protein U0T74_08765 [Chitinophagales bacterium]
MIHQFIFWLQTHRGINILLVLAYFSFIIAMHHPLVLLSISIENRLTIETYNLVVAVVFLTLLSLFLFFLSKGFFKYTDNRKLKLVYMLATLLLLLLHSRFMFDSNIEVIHSFEFTFLAFLIFPLTKRFGAAILFTLPFMLIDEWYQYIFLYPQWNDYFDLNDILTDTYGCGLTMLFLMIVGVKGNENLHPIWRRAEFIGLIIGVILVALANQLGYIVSFANEVGGNTLLVMNENLNGESFWRAHPTHHILYHVMKPVEGLIAISALHFFYFGLDSLRKNPA